MTFDSQASAVKMLALSKDLTLRDSKLNVAHAFKRLKQNNNRPLQPVRIQTDFNGGGGGGYRNHILLLKTIITYLYISNKRCNIIKKNMVNDRIEVARRTSRQTTIIMDQSRT